MIFISEVSHPGEVHLEFNSSFLDVIHIAMPTDAIIFRAEAGHIKAVEKMVAAPANFKFLSFDKYYDPKQFSWLKRIFGEMREIRKSLRLGKKQQADTFIWTCIFPTGQLFLSIYLFLFGRKDIRHLVVLHGELEFLKNAGGKKVDFFLGMILKRAIIMSKSNISYIVLGDRIKDRLAAYFPDRVLKKVIPILHPYHYDISLPAGNFKGGLNPILFGAIGTQMLSKNSNQIFTLAESLESGIAAGDFSFITIGKVLPELYSYKNKFVTQLYADSFVPQSIFGEEARKLDFVLFFYDDKAYRLCASGAIFEVIKLGLPLISIFNDYFDWLFSKYGQLGFLCKNLGEIKDLILRIKKGELDSQVNSILKNIAEFRKQNSLESIAEDLSGKLKIN